MTRKNRQRGVTLLELLIVVVIVAILASIAYPSYRQHVQRAKRTEAMSALLQIATEQERYYLSHNEYTTSLAALEMQDTTATGTYAISLSSDDVAETYTATADYQLTDDEESKCNTFSIDATGAKTSSPTTECWTSTR